MSNKLIVLSLSILFSFFISCDTQKMSVGEVIANEDALLSQFEKGTGTYCKTFPGELERKERIGSNFSRVLGL